MISFTFRNASARSLYFGRPVAASCGLYAFDRFVNFALVELLQSFVIGIFGIDVLLQLLFEFQPFLPSLDTQLSQDACALDSMVTASSYRPTRAAD